jgi:transposase
MALPGVGRLTAMTLVAEIGDIARRRGRNIATVAIARRLLARCFHILNRLEATTIGEGQTGCARNNRMRLQHGR